MRTFTHGKRVLNVGATGAAEEKLVTINAAA